MAVHVLHYLVSPLKYEQLAQVQLTQLTQQSTGRYRCEVSTEAPSFATVSSYGDMLVVGK